MSTSIKRSLFGYTDPMSVAAGESLRVMVSSESGQLTYRADLVRLFCGDDHPDGPGFREIEIDNHANASYPARWQQTHAGSCIRIESCSKLDAIDSFTVSLLVWPTRPVQRAEGLVSRWCETEQRGFSLYFDQNGCANLALGDGQPLRCGCDKPLIPREWYLIGASFDAKTGIARVQQTALAPRPHPDPTTMTSTRFDVRPNHQGLPLLLAAWTDAGTHAGHFNGKLERPRLWQTAFDATEATIDLETDTVGAWDFCAAIDTDNIIDRSPNGLDGSTVNLPTRAVTGYAWSGEHHNWQHKPEHYGAIYFHQDDLYDAAWKPDFNFTLPTDTPSGIYAIRLRDAGNEEHVPFFVRPGRTSQKARIVFLASTATYMAYANNHAAYTEVLDEMEWGSLTEVQPNDVYLSAHYELGLSTYDTHLDGSGVPYSSRLRPILDMRPRSRLWNFNADLHVIDWLDHEGYEVDVVTDEDLDREGSALLEPYTLLITGTHPEYCSHTMVDAVEAFTRGKGRLMYLGGNGFYWCISFHPTLPGVIECRKSQGVRSWETQPGEHHHSFTGEPGGLWRQLGRAPQRLTGVGTAAFGFDSCGWYQRQPASFDPRAEFIFEGIEADEPIGNFGVTGGAVGFEIDRVDRNLGTPAHCLVLASSAPLSRLYMLSPEEVRFLYPAMSGEENNQVRADMTFYEGSNRGAVFSVGSITWSASLSFNDYDNNVSRITRNVVERFLDPAPFY